MIVVLKEYIVYQTEVSKFVFILQASTILTFNNTHCIQMSPNFAVVNALCHLLPCNFRPST